MEFAESTTAEQSSQPYKYNGKEQDDTHGLNWYDYSARFYDPGYIRTPTIDPLAELYYSVSPYVYCANNPMKFVDPTGMAYRYVYPNEEEGEKGGYYVNDNGDKVEWEEVSKWLNASSENITDQNDAWGMMNLMATNGGRAGHAWLDFNGKDGSIKTFGLFEKGAINDNKVKKNYLDAFDAFWRNKFKEFQINYERDKSFVYYEDKKNPVASISVIITKKQRLLIDMYNLNKDRSGNDIGTDNLSWGYLHNCVDYSVGGWEFIKGSAIYSEFLWRDPKNLFKTLNVMQSFIPVNVPTKK